MRLWCQPESLNCPDTSATRAPLTLVFVRHAQAEGRELGESGPPLTHLGRAQARLLARRMAHSRFTHAYVSDLARARQTCDAVTERKMIPTTVTRDLREVAGQHAEAWLSPTAAPVTADIEGEERAMHRFASHLMNAHRAGETILIVAHGNVMRSLIAMLADGKPTSSLMLEFNNTAVTVVDIWPSNRVILRLANCVRHLQPRQMT